MENEAAKDQRARLRRDRLLAFVALVAAVFLVLRAVRKDEGVLARNREFGTRFLAHQDPYFDFVRGHRVHGPYPPSYALVTVPLALVPERVARWSWALAQIGALAAAFVLLRNWLRRAWPGLAPHASVIYALALLLASRFLLRDMAGGGGNILYAVTALWGIEFALRERTLHAAGLIALTLVLKPNLAPLVLFLLCRWHWRAFAATLFASAILFSSPALVYGLQPYFELTLRWFGDVVRFMGVTQLADPSVVPDGFPLADTSMNQSLREALWRFLAPDAAACTARILALAITLIACVSATRARGERAVLLALAGFLPVSLLISPISWKAHHVALLPLFFVLLADAWESRRKWLAGLLVAYYLCCVLLSEEIVGKAMKNTLQEQSIVTVGALVLFVAAVFVTGRTSVEVKRGAT